MHARSGPRADGIALIGAGNVGTAVSVLLSRAGHRIAGVSSRSQESAAAAAERLDAEVFDHEETLPECDWVLIATPDGAIEEVASSLASRIVPGTNVCHFSGASGVSPLKALSDAGAIVLATHPVQACPTVDAAIRRLPGSAWGVTVSRSHRATAEAFVSDVHGRPVWVEEDHRPVWHAASVTVSNGLAALMATGEAILRSIEVDAPEEVLLPLVSGTLKNVEEGGGGGPTLTGPIVRRERETIRRHLAALENGEPHVARAYRLAARSIVGAARSAGRIDDATATEMIDLIGPE